VHLISPETKQNGLPQLGLLKDDIYLMEQWIRDFLIRDQFFLEFAVPMVPIWLTPEYDNLTDEVALSWEQWIGRDGSPDQLGSLNVRLGLLDHMLQIENLKYVYIKKSIKNDPEYAPIIEKRKHAIELRLVHAAQKYEHIARVQNNQVHPGVEYIIFPAEDLTDQPFITTLQVILNTHPTLKVLIVFNDSHRATPRAFVVPVSIKDVVFAGRNIVQIGDGFLHKCINLTHIDLRPLFKIIQIGTHFLDECSGLTSLDLPPLTFVKQIRDSFLQNCSGLKKLYLDPLSGITHIGDFFLSGCTGLRVLNLSALLQLIHIGNAFLDRCNRLISVNLNSLSQITVIGDFFLSECSDLRRLNLCPLSHVKQIGDGFLLNCTGLISLDLTPLSSVKQVGKAFLKGCKGLENIRLTKNLYNLLYYHNDEKNRYSVDPWHVDVEVVEKLSEESLCVIA
ncbi:MAG TPA: leucine-rich repeat protein, partial [Candidatus Saccharimonadales bacterium]|nr:leucine-rich repeat protein [Candidatus Saccharimonadales bacterium]